MVHRDPYALKMSRSPLLLKDISSLAQRGLVVTLRSAECSFVVSGWLEQRADLTLKTLRPFYTEKKPQQLWL